MSLSAVTLRVALATDDAFGVGTWRRVKDITIKDVLSLTLYMKLENAE